jgi:O-acetyl-ADP-ribose deacetylase (regulator of RNase III)
MDERRSTKAERIFMNRVQVIRADITQLKVDAIVNAANRALCGGGGVDGAIHHAAGPELLAECRTLAGCQTGKAKITKGYNLPARYIIHTVGPAWEGGHKNEEDLLVSCYRSSLELARAHRVKTIAFPAISCGAYQFPLPRAASIAMQAIEDELTEYDELESLIIAAFEPATERAFMRALQAARGHDR